MQTNGLGGPVVRHPLDPEPVRSTKAGTVFALGLLAVLTGPFVGGVVPASVALLLHRQARREAYRAKGFLTGAAWLRRGEWLAWTGLILAAASLAVALTVGLLQMADAPGGRDFDPDIN